MKAILAFVLIAIPAGLNAQAERKFIRQGNRAFDNGKYPVAEISYRKALEKDTSSIPAGYNLGNALYKEKQYEAAASRYEAMVQSQQETGARAGQFYNLGNALYQAGKYKESIEAYKNALRQVPGDKDAKHNLQLAMNKLREQQNQQNQQDQNKDQGGKGDRKDQQQDAQNEQNQGQNENDEKQQNKGEGQQNENQNVKGQISRQDAERILQALENEEKDVLKKVQDQKQPGRKAPVDKNW